MNTWLVPRSELTEDQRRASEMPPTEHRLIIGSPGSGKTLVLIHRAIYLMKQYNISPEEFRIFVYTNTLKAYIQSALDLLGLPLECAQSFNSWCKGFYEKEVSRRVPWDGDARMPDFEAIRNGVLEKVRSGAAKYRQYDFVLVDEGQDLSADAFTIMKQISNHVTVVMDHKQQIYDKGSCETHILGALGLKKRNIALLEAYRCNPHIVQIACAQIQEGAERESFARQTKVPTERETPLLFLAENPYEEIDRLADVIKTRQQKGERIAILLPTKRHVFGFAKGLKDAGLEVEVPKQPGRNQGDRRIHDFNSDYPKLMPYHSAKGLTFDTVMLPRLCESQFAKLSKQMIGNLLFVGITRARKWLYMSSIRGRELPQLASFMALRDKGCISVQIQRFKNDMFESPEEGSETSQKFVRQEAEQNNDLADMF